MKLLLDQNISFRIVKKLPSFFNAKQVREMGLENKSDIEIWEYAKAKNFTIVTFDADFYDFSILFGHPPKIIWLRTGNTSTQNISKIIIEKSKIIEDFILAENYAELSCLEITAF